MQRDAKSKEEVSILELAERVTKATSSRSEIAMIPYAEAYEDGFEDMYRRVPDISKVGGMIGWSPTRSLGAIIDEVAEAQRAAAVI